MTGEQARRFDRAFKVAALERMALGENVSALSRRRRRRPAALRRAWVKFDVVWTAALIAVGVWLLAEPPRRGGRRGGPARWRAAKVS